MPADFEVRGADDLHRLARRLKTAPKELRRELHSGLNRAVKPLMQAVKEAAGEFLPDRYADELAGSLKVKTRKRTGARNPGISLTGSAVTAAGKPRDLRSLERGKLRHPLYGNRRHWFDQTVDPGWWSKPLEAGSPLVRLELERVVDEVTRKLERAV